MSGSLVNLPYYSNPDVCPRCGGPWYLVTELHFLDGSTRPAPEGLDLRHCECLLQPPPVVEQIVQLSFLEAV